MISKEDIVVALSYSGETDEILKIVPSSTPTATSWFR